MSSETRTRPVKSLAIRLTSWYAGIITFSFLVMQMVSYFVIQSNLASRVDQMLYDEVAEDIGLFQAKGLATLMEDFREEVASVGEEKEFFRVLDAQGQVLGASDLSKWPNLAVRQDAVQRALTGKAELHTLKATTDHPNARVIYALLAPGLIIQIGYSRASDERLLENYRETYGIAVVAILLCSVAVGWLMAKRLLAGVENVTQTAARITHGDLNSRATIMGKGDEIDELAKTFNQMIERIQTLITGMKDITDDIAHDLRSPIMRMRGAAEMALTHAAPLDQQESVVGGIVEECDNLLSLINTMLEISETEAGVAQLTRENFDLAGGVRDIVELFTPASEDKGVSLNYQSAGSAIVRGDQSKIRRAIGHIVDNAVKYTAAGGSITVACSTDSDTAKVSIKDTGIGIAESDHSAIFSRFYRADRSRSEPGNGLGLSLSNAIIKAHGGAIGVQSVLGQGSTFTISLPKAAQS
ncbi:MAG: HAMP domain-containing protein [Candidatus Hydrogenedentes bacterium]|nr:HAMP domain-containing protein [Candidatus Hydrogenedentota bacterium]